MPLGAQESFSTVDTDVAVRLVRKRQRPEKSDVDVLPTAEAGGFPCSRSGLPASRGRANAPTFRFAHWAYRPSKGDDGAPLRQDIAGCVDVTVVGCPTLRAGPRTYGESQGVQYMATVGTAFAGWAETVNVQDCRTLPCTFILHLA